MANIFERLLQGTIIEAARKKTKKSKVKYSNKYGKKSQEDKERETRDWLVNKSQGAKQAGTSNRVTSGNKTTNASSDHNKERAEQINYNNTQQGQAPIKDDDKHNERVTQLKAVNPVSNAISAKDNKKFRNRVKASVKYTSIKAKPESEAKDEDKPEQKSNKSTPPPLPHMPPSSDTRPLPDPKSVKVPKGYKPTVPPPPLPDMKPSSNSNELPEPKSVKVPKQPKKAKPAKAAKPAGDSSNSEAPKVDTSYKKPKKASISKAAVTKSAAKGVLGSIITNM